MELTLNAPLGDSERLEAALAVGMPVPPALRVPGSTVRVSTSEALAGLGVGERVKAMQGDAVAEALLMEEPEMVGEMVPVVYTEKLPKGPETEGLTEGLREMLGEPVTVGLAEGLREPLMEPVGRTVPLRERLARRVIDTVDVMVASGADTEPVGDTLKVYMTVACTSAVVMAV